MVRWVDNLLLLLLLLFICNTSQGGDSAAYKKQLEAFCTSSCEHLQNRIASNSNGEDAQKKPFPTVDIFYLFSLQESKAEYLNRRYFWLLPIVAQLLSRLDKNANRSDTRIHIVTDSDVLLQEAANAGFHPYDIRTYRALNQEFIHLVTKSTSSLEYRVTIYRWLVYDLIVKEWNAKRVHNPSKQITRILALDGDVLMTMNAADFYQRMLDTVTPISTTPIPTTPIHGYTNMRAGDGLTNMRIGDGVPSDLPNESHYDLINVAFGSIDMFSVQGLHLFASYIFDWYYNGTEDVVMNKVHWTGGRYFSDMILIRDFIQMNRARRSTCFEHHKANQYYSHWKQDKNNLCLLKQVGCVPMSNYKAQSKHMTSKITFYMDGVELDYRKGSSIGNRSEAIIAEEETVNDSASRPLRPEMTDPYVRGFDEAYPYSLLHFQGEGTKHLIYPYARAFQILLTNRKYDPGLNHYNSHVNVSAMHIRHKYPLGMILVESGSDEANIVYENGTRVVSSIKDLTNNGYNRDQMIFDVPGDLIAAFSL